MAAGHFSCFARTVTLRVVTSMAGNGIVFQDGRIESGVSVGDAGLVPGCAILPKAAICVPQVSGDLDSSAPSLALRQPTTVRVALQPYLVVFAHVQLLTYKRLARLTEPSAPASADKRALEPKHANRRATVDAYIEEVLSKRSKRISRKDIWVKAGYQTRTEFERWQRRDRKHPNKAADKNFMRHCTALSLLKKLTSVRIPVQL